MYAHFIIPFLIGTIFLFAVIIWKWSRWLWRLPVEDKRAVRRGVFSWATVRGAWEVVTESLVHRKIFRTNPMLGFMHMSFALGWFLLIVVGWIEAAFVFDNPEGLHAHVFFRYFDPQPAQGGWNPLAIIMDLLLLMLLVGVTMAWVKRLRSRIFGMRRTTRHVAIDRVALASLWCIFPLRLVAESFMAAIKYNGGFLTGSIGEIIAANMNYRAIVDINSTAWWLYSFALGTFFVAMPFSRYMHIFTEMPLIFLRRWKLRSGERESSYDNFQIQACSRCGICLDPCQLQKDLGMDNVQAAYFLRDRRYGRLTDEVRDNCLMCGQCEGRCPVGIELNTLRLNSRAARRDAPASTRYGYLRDADRSSGHGATGYFAGCMTPLTPATMLSMEKIFSAAGEEVWWADREGGVCCGRPLKLTGEVAASRRMMEFNKELFRRHDIKTLVISCPICLKVFKEDYDLADIEVLHHSEYILRLVGDGRLKLSAPGDEAATLDKSAGEATVAKSSRNGKIAKTENSTIAGADTTTIYTYHDPCELGRGAGIFEEPRELIRLVGRLVEPEHTREEALCCGSSLANTAIDDSQQAAIARSMAGELERTGADVIVTACPLCKKAIARGTSARVADLSQIVAEAIDRQ